MGDEEVELCCKFADIEHWNDLAEASMDNQLGTLLLLSQPEVIFVFKYTMPVTSFPMMPPLGSLRGLSSASLSQNDREKSIQIVRNDSIDAQKRSSDEEPYVIVERLKCAAFFTC